MDKLILKLILTILCCTITVDCLQCYVCIDCPNLKNAFLVTCDGSVISTTTLPTTLTTPIPSTINGTSTTVPNNTTSLINMTVVTNLTTPATTTQAMTTTTPRPVSQINTTSTNNNTNHNDSVTTMSRTRREILKQNIDDVTSKYKASNTTLVYYCYKSTVKVNLKKQIVRGCASRLQTSNKTICDDTATDPMVTACQTCTTDKCNSAFTTQLSLLLLIITTPLSLY